MPASNADNVLKFKGQCDAFAALIDVNVATVCKVITTDLFGLIVDGTPVDTGRARSSWAFSLDAASDFVPPQLTKDQERQRDQAKDKKQESPIFFDKPQPPDVSQIDGTQLIFICSNLVYIEPLENGHSQQAPAGMVKVAIVTEETVIEARILHILGG